MVEDAEGESVADLVRPTVRVPLDVRRLQPDEVVVETDIEAAHDTASLVRPQDGMAETWIADVGRLRLEPLLNGPRKPDRVADGVVPGGWKVLVEEPSSCLLDEFGVGEEHPPVLIAVLLRLRGPRLALYEDDLFVPRVEIETLERLAARRRPKTLAQAYAVGRLDVGAVAGIPPGFRQTVRS